MRTQQERISIWFFIGLMLIAAGALVCGAGVWDYVHPPEQPTVLANLHAGVWWGAVLLATGLFYSLRFAPRRG